MFCEENYNCNSEPAHLKKNKSTKTMLEKIIKKNHVGNTLTIHNVLKKNTIKLNSQHAQY